MILGCGCAVILLLCRAGYWHERISRILVWNPNLVPEEQVPQPQLPPPPSTQQSQPQKNRARKRRRRRQQQKGQDRSVAACLLIKDDNEILGEWIAYHYFALNVRRLIVAIDPNSVTSPIPILKRWTQQQQNHTSHNHDNTTMQQQPMMGIQIWSDPDFMPPSFLETKDPKMNSPTTQQNEEEEEEEDSSRKRQRQVDNHRFRQVTFLSACLTHFRSKNHTWVIHIDTDEYVVVNPLLRSNHTANSNNHTTATTTPEWFIPSVSQPSSVYRVLEQIRHNRHFRIRTKYPCISMPRLVFGSVEEEEEEEPNKNDTNASTTTSREDFDSRRFETLRWKFHTQYNDTERNAQPKCMVDVSRVTNHNDRMFHNPFSIHRPSAILCRGISHIHMYETDAFPLIVHHYTGSRERYFGKNDTRRNEETYQAKANVRDGYDDGITSWLDGFIQWVGVDMARSILPEYLVKTQTDVVVDG